MLLTVHLPPVPTVAVCGAELCVPSLATTVTVSPAVPVPLAEVFVWFVESIAAVTVVIATVGATVSFVAVFVDVAVLPAASLAVAV